MSDQEMILTTHSNIINKIAIHCIIGIYKPQVPFNQFSRAGLRDTFARAALQGHLYGTSPPLTHHLSCPKTLLYGSDVMRSQDTH